MSTTVVSFDDFRPTADDPAAVVPAGLASNIQGADAFSLIRLNLLQPGESDEV